MLPLGNPPTIALLPRKKVQDVSDVDKTTRDLQMLGIHNITSSMHVHFLSPPRDNKPNGLMIIPSGCVINPQSLTIRGMEIERVML